MVVSTEVLCTMLLFNSTVVAILHSTCILWKPKENASYLVSTMPGKLAELFASSSVLIYYQIPRLLTYLHN